MTRKISFKWSAVYKSARCALNRPILTWEQQRYFVSRLIFRGAVVMLLFPVSVLYLLLVQFVIRLQNRIGDFFYMYPVLAVSISVCIFWEM